MKPKYVVCPGIMTSKTDGQTHYVGSMQLMRLYGVAPQECEIYEPAPWWPRSYYKAAEERQQGMIRLHPRYDGDYTLPSNAEITGAGGFIACVRVERRVMFLCVDTKTA